MKLSSLSRAEREQLKQEYQRQVLNNVLVFKGNKYYVSDVADYLNSLRR